VFVLSLANNRRDTRRAYRAVGAAAGYAADGGIRLNRPARWRIASPYTIKYEHLKSNYIGGLQ